MHFVFVFDESGSMNGPKYQGLYKSLKAFIAKRVSYC